MSTYQADDLRRNINPFPESKTCLQMLRLMRQTRVIDAEASRLQRAGRLDLWLSCEGQEAAQVASAKAVTGVPWIFPTYRDHGVLLTRGITPVEILAQWAGRNFCGWDPGKSRVFPNTLVLATQTLHGVGLASALRYRNDNEPVCIYVGDGATSEGDMGEAMNLAAVEQLPVLFICQNNGWAISKPSSQQMHSNITERAEGYGIKAVSIGALDPDATFSTVADSYRIAKTSGTPRLVELNCVRLGSHSTSDNDELYKTEAHRAHDQEAKSHICLYQKRLLNEGIVSEEMLERWAQDEHHILTVMRGKYGH